MIVFKEFIEDQKGIQFNSLESQEIIIKIIDGYTGLCSYQEKMFVEPNLKSLGIDKEIFEYKWNMRKYKDDLHYLLAFICHLQTPISILNNCNMYQIKLIICKIHIFILC